MSSLLMRFSGARVHRHILQRGVVRPSLNVLPRNISAPLILPRRALTTLLESEAAAGSGGSPKNAFLLGSAFAIGALGIGFVRTHNDRHPHHASERSLFASENEQFHLGGAGGAASATEPPLADHDIFEDAFSDRIYANEPVLELLRALVVFTVCSSPLAVKIAPLVLDFALAHPVLCAPVLFLTKHSVYRHFVAGESMDSALVRLSSLRRNGTDAILTLCIEDADPTFVPSLTDSSVMVQDVETDDATRDHNALDVIRTLERSAGVEGVAFFSLKITSLCDPSLLGKLTKVIGDLETETSGRVTATMAYAYLNERERREYDLLMKRLHTICRTASDKGLPLLFDAEQTHRQPAIDFLVLDLSKTYNAPPPDVGIEFVPILYNTFQMYLRNELQVLKNSLSIAEEDGFVLGIKLVRGAYMDTEREAARREERPSPIHPSKECTDAAYNEALALALSLVPRDKSPFSDEFSGAGTTAIMAATHNHDSVQFVKTYMTNNGIPRAHPRVHCAQLFGMANTLTVSTSRAGMNSVKLVPFGLMEETMPYLVRRMVENNSAVEPLRLERNLVVNEIFRRIIGLVYPSMPF
eukprot:TRINITY_DN8758_c0_g1_i1.p1 TRINITY_DN8758_c0_g1~~TRINITY_DN8758_c0_g1_i1.p1  ORF type:complete len:584 (+),score=115.11 TRINITY_DN8758_c0_g1_i1:222-1973(+)